MPSSYTGAVLLFPRHQLRVLCEKGQRNGGLYIPLATVLLLHAK